MIRYAGSVLAITLLGAGVAAASTAGSVSRQTADRSQHGWMAPDANPQHAWLYVGAGSGNDVTIYDLDRLGAPQIGTIKAGVSEPGGIALDASGNLYVPNETGGNVTVYAPGATTPSLTLTAPGPPETVAIDANSDVWLAVRGSNPGIAEYLPGQTTPTQYVTSSLFKTPAGIEFDSTGTLYITDDSSGVSILPPGQSQKVTSLNLNDLLPNTTSGLAINPVTNEFYISFAQRPPTDILEFVPSEQNPERARKVTFGGINFMTAGILKGKVRVFAPNSSRNIVYVFDATLHGTPSAISTAANGAEGVAFKPAGVP